MPPKKVVISLQNLSSQTIESFVTAVCNNVLQNEEFLSCDFTGLIGTLKIRLYDNTAWCLHNEIALHCLKALDKFYEHYSAQNSEQLLSKCETTVKNLAMLIPQPKLEQLELTEWSAPIQHVLIEHLNQMTGLESFTCLRPHESVDFSVIEQKILNNFQALSYLTMFNMSNNCNDQILAVISEHCKGIRSISAEGSRQVSDLSIDGLVKCTELQHVELNKTLVSQRGFFKLLTETTSKNLINIGNCCHLPTILDLLEAYVEPLRTYQIQYLRYFNVDTEHLFLVCKYFPQLTELLLYHDSVVPDLFCLSRLQNLRKVTLSICDFYSDRLGDFLTARGSFITSLNLHIVGEMQISCIIHIGVSCPNIECLSFHECEFFEDAVFPRVELTTEPFQKLKNFHCVSNIVLPYVQFVLRYAYNIETLQLRPAQIITDEFFHSVFTFNSLKQLRDLKIDFVNTVSLDMLKLIITRCDKISSIGHFSGSTAISKEDLKYIKNFITASNYDLDLQ